MKFSRKMCFKIVLKVTENQGSTLSIEDIFFKKPHKEGGQFDTPRQIRVNKTYFICIYNLKTYYLKILKLSIYLI